jgi:hypothetical protein
MRLSNWDINLAQYLEDLRDYPFRWGQNDCITFTNRCAEILTGEGYCDDWLGQYTDGKSAFIHYRRKLSEQGYSNIFDALDGRLERFTERFPPRGTLVGRESEDMAGVLPIAMGVVVSDLAAFLTADGLILSNLSDSDLFWSLD